MFCSWSETKLQVARLNHITRRNLGHLSTVQRGAETSEGNQNNSHLTRLWLRQLRLTQKTSDAEMGDKRSEYPSGQLLFISVCLLVSFSEECCGVVSFPDQHFCNDSCVQADFPHFPQLGPRAQKTPTNSRNQSKCMKTCRWLQPSCLLVQQHFNKKLLDYFSRAEYEHKGKWVSQVLTIQNTDHLFYFQNLCPQRRFLH